MVGELEKKRLIIRDVKIALKEASSGTLRSTNHPNLKPKGEIPYMFVQRRYMGEANVGKGTICDWATDASTSDGNKEGIGMTIDFNRDNREKAQIPLQSESGSYNKGPKVRESKEYSSWLS
uniref:Ovule protein n=1 Tax=Steinernema glaseri TaxID=37863 RepID=A0A1I8A529_9BILA